MSELIRNTRIELANGTYLVVDGSLDDAWDALRLGKPVDQGFKDIRIANGQSARLDPRHVVALWELVPIPASTTGPIGAHAVSE